MDAITTQQPPESALKLVDQIRELYLPTSTTPRLDAARLIDAHDAEALSEIGLPVFAAGNRPSGPTKRGPGSVGSKSAASSSRSIAAWPSSARRSSISRRWHWETTVCMVKAVVFWHWGQMAMQLCKTLD